MKEETTVNPALVKTGLVSGGVLFLILSFLVAFLGGGANLTFTAFFLLVGVGFFVALDYYSARLRPVYRARAMDFDDQGEALATAGGPPLGSVADESPVAARTAASGGGSGERMSHLDAADYLFQKIVDADGEEAVNMLIQEMARDLAGKGYSAKGLSEFRARLATHLTSLTEGGDERVQRNKRQALAAIANLEQ